MDLRLSGEFAKHLYVMAKKDIKLAQSLAQQFLDSIDKSAMAQYLLTTDVAKELLAEKIKKDPEETLRILQRLPTLEEGSRVGRGKKRGPKPGRKAAQAKESGGIGKGHGKRRKRQRLTAEHIQQIKDAVQAFLHQSPWSTRKQLTKNVSFPSVAAYNRIMAELREDGDILAQGEKSKTLYAAKGASGGKPGKVSAKNGNSSKGKKAGASKKGPKKEAVPKKPAAPRKQVFCPYPGCTNKAAPIFKMMCKEHKDVTPEEREKYFADRREPQPAPQPE